MPKQQKQQHQSKHRAQSHFQKNYNEDLLYGKNSLKEAFDADISINKIWFLQDSPNPKIKELELIARERKIPFYKVDRKELDRIAGSDEHRGVIAKISPVKLLEEDDIFENSYKKILLAVNIEDPHNLGAIIRTALAFGIDALGVNTRNSCSINPTVLSSSAGAALKLKLFRVTNTTNFILKAKKLGFWVYATATRAQDSNNIHELIFDDKSIILVGNEGKGLSDKVLNHCDFRIHIPVKFESLNVSVATGIVLSRLAQD